MSRKLKFFNGRTFDWHRWKGWHTNIAAYSKTDAARLLSQAANHARNSYNEINVYFSPCWGTVMQEVVPNPERGVYMEHEQTREIRKIL